MAVKLLFTKYRKSSSDTKVLLLYLLLNKYEINQIRQLEETEEDRMFGLKIRKIYGVTKEYIDVRKIEEEIESIQNPIICSPQSYEYCKRYKWQRLTMTARKTVRLRRK
ncbi:MAG: hypothetical protein NC489_15875 [Ruminococcus flavefaciens]|nr:hypothetical protein [Ruminococcus flavefaciens]